MRSTDHATGAAAVAVVFDLGNVLIRWDPQPAVAAELGAEEATRFLTATDFDFAAWNYEQDRGRRWDEAEAAAVRSHPHWERHLLAYRRNFDASLTGPIEDSVQILRELHSHGVPLFALTNWSAELFPRALARFDFLSLFDDIVVSGDERVAKPAPEIFDLLRQRVRRPLTECVFVDDSPANVEAASSAGMDALVFTDTGHLRDDLRARGLPLAAPKR
ncbi:MAG TPA: HAD family phosphatase [Nocardioidaceae bacterium]|nr:HAD family phosphatase [Nocardioidaceae bacterium]